MWEMDNLEALLVERRSLVLTKEEEDADVPKCEHNGAQGTSDSIFEDGAGDSVHKTGKAHLGI